MNNIKVILFKKRNYFTTFYTMRKKINTSTVLFQKTPLKRICVVGAGPAGFYASQYLLKHISDCEIDILEKLPVPFGLVRFGVAPDHPEVKNVINTFTKVAENSRCHFYGNMELGKDFTLNELREKYHAVLLSYGATEDRKLNIPNEQNGNILSAREFVAWYNGLPGAESLKPQLNTEDITIIGQGNVAIDVARMLLSPLDVLKKTDTTEYALQTLSESKIKRVYLVGRRGPLQAAFSIKELREMLKLPNVHTKWRNEDFRDIESQIPNLPRARKRLTELMLKSLKANMSSPSSYVKEFLPVFLRAPNAIKGNKVEFTITKLEENVAVSTNDIEMFPGDLVFRSIGYKSICVDKQICFDEKKGCVFNHEGRVYENKEEKTFARGLYVTGWLGTGPTGVILSTMYGSYGVAKAIYEDILNNIIDVSQSKPGLTFNNMRIVDWNGWEKINQFELKAGVAKGKPREKIINIDQMLSVAGV